MQGSKSQMIEEPIELHNVKIALRINGRTPRKVYLAARQEIFAFTEKERGDGWWGDNSSVSYYDDHAGEQETSLMMAFCPKGVDMSRFTDTKWYSQRARTASPDYRNRAKALILRNMKNTMGK